MSSQICHSFDTISVEGALKSLKHMVNKNRKLSQKMAGSSTLVSSNFDCPYGSVLSFYYLELSEILGSAPCGATPIYTVFRARRITFFLVIRV